MNTQNEKTDREKAMDWWSFITCENRQNLADIYFFGRGAVNLTGREIQQIWEKETAPNDIPDPLFQRPIDVFKELGGYFNPKNDLP